MTGADHYRHSGSEKCVDEFEFLAAMNPVQIPGVMSILVLRVRVLRKV